MHLARVFYSTPLKEIKRTQVVFLISKNIGKKVAHWKTINIYIGGYINKRKANLKTTVKASAACLSPRINYL